MDTSSLQQQLMMALDDLDKIKSENRELQENLDYAKNFIQSLKDKINESREKRKELCGQLKQKNKTGEDEQLSQALKEKIEECEMFSQENVALKHET